MIWFWQLPGKLNCLDLWMLVKKSVLLNKDVVFHCRPLKVESWHNVNPCTARTTLNTFISYSARSQTNILRSLYGWNGLSLGTCWPIIPLSVHYPATPVNQLLWTFYQNIFAQICLLLTEVPFISSHTFLLPLWSHLYFPFLYFLKIDFLLMAVKCTSLSPSL